MLPASSDLFRALADPFPQSEIEFKPAMVKANRALTLAYLTARAVEDRLDAVVGPQNWRDVYTMLADGSVLCRLDLRIDGEWIGKEDVGSQSEQPDSGDRMKAAHSDALKRAAVKWGIGRYLYFLDQSWCDYDPVKKRIVQEPRLPAWALPGGSGRPHLKAASPAKAAAPEPRPSPAPAPSATPEAREAIEEEVAKLIEAVATAKGVQWPDAYWVAARHLKFDYPDLADFPLPDLLALRAAVRKSAAKFTTGKAAAV